MDYSQKILAFAVIGVALVMGAGNLYHNWSASSASERDPSSNQPAENLWVGAELYPTKIQSYDNGTYSLTLNNKLRIKFIRLNGDKIQWPTGQNGTPVVTIKSDDFGSRLAQALRTGLTRDGESKLSITDVTTRQINGKNATHTGTVTLNDKITLQNINLMQSGDDRWLGWPTTDYQDQQVKLLETWGSFEDKLLTRLINNSSHQPVKKASNSDLPKFPLPGEAVRARVIKVFDGDTFKARFMDGTDKEVVVRIAGMNCPESSRNDKCVNDEYRDGMSCEEEIPYGKRAARVGKRWLSNNQVILVPNKDDGFEEGYYGRFIAYVRMNNGVDYGLKMIHNGYCKDTSEEYPHKRGSTYQRYEEPLKPLH